MSPTTSCPSRVCYRCDEAFAGVDRDNCLAKYVRTECDDSHPYCKTEVTKDASGINTRYQIFCATTVQCPTALFMIGYEQNCTVVNGIEYCNQCENKQCSDGVDDPCAEDPCFFGSTCTDVRLGNFQCMCPDGYTGTTCESQTGEAELLAFGVAEGDAVVRNTEDIPSERVAVQNKVNYLDSFYNELYINSNGYVSFGFDFAGAYVQPIPLASHPQVSLVAPLWADFDLSQSTGIDTGQVFYRVVERLTDFNYVGEKANNLFGRVEEMVKDGYSDTAFKPNLVTVVTWVNVTFAGFPVNSQDKRQATFQTAIAMDYARYRSYVIFLYGKVVTEDKSIRTVEGLMAPYNFLTQLRETIQLPTSFTSAYPFLPVLEGTYGKRGVWVFKTSSASTELTYDSPEYKCWVWSYNQASQRSFVRLADFFLPHCPCLWFFVVFSGNFIPDFSTGCATTWTLRFGTYARTCCYRRTGSSSLLFAYSTLIVTNDYYGGSILQYNPYYYPALYYENDYFPKQWCCLQSANCHYYYQNRPTENCFLWFFRWLLSWLFGDPHIVTVDGLNYTYQGVGEFWLLKSKDSSVTVQGRTAQVIDQATGQLTGASSWSAIAFQDKTTTNNNMDSSNNVTTSANHIHVALNDTQNGLYILIQETDEDLSEWFTNAPEGNFTISGGITFIKQDNTLVCKLPSELEIRVKAGVQQLGLSVVVKSELFDTFTGGLLGYPDGNSSNDFTLPNGTLAFGGSTDVTESEIYDGFGEIWRIVPTESVFAYPIGKSARDYVSPPGYTPIFGDALVSGASQNELNEAEGVCGASESTCITDYLITKNKALAEDTKETSVINQDIEQTLSIVVPVIAGPPSINVTVGESSSLTVSVNGTDQPVEMYANFTLPSGASFDGTTGVFEWNVTDHNVTPFNMLFGGRDDIGTEAVAHSVTVYFCNCSSEFGDCPEELTFPVADSTFEMAHCVCLPPYTGDVCESDLDSCADHILCPNLTACVDLNITIHAMDLYGPGYICTGCPSGYNLTTISGGRPKCEDINECANNPPCEQVCLNTVGSYICSCISGYNLENDGSSCTDIDECVLMISNCEQYCDNTVGSYNCSCRDGFIPGGRPIGSLCTQSAKTKAACDLVFCEDGCFYNGTATECFCSNGYEQDTANTSLCSDIDECTDGPDECGPNSVCNNTAGGYLCDCNDGYTLNTDQRSCSSCPDLFYGPGCANLCNKCTSVENCNNTYGCTKCIPGWIGPACAKDIDECKEVPNPCNLTLSNCTNTEGSYLCNCLAGYVQTTSGCEEEDDCLNNTACGSNGGCIDKFLTYDCDCRSGYTGVYCETNIDDCTATSCLFGGTCVDLVDSFTCTCTQERYGAFCQYISIASECVDNGNLTDRFYYNGTLKINNVDYTDELANTSSSEYQMLSSDLTIVLKDIYDCLARETNTRFVALENVTFGPAQSIWVYWDLTLMIEVDPGVLADIINDRSDRFLGVGYDIENATYVLFEPGESSEIDILYIVLGTIGAILFICLLVLIIMCVLIRIRKGDDDDSSTDSDSIPDEHKQAWGTRFSGLHWQNVPSMRSGTSPNSYSDYDGSDSYADTYAPRIPRPRVMAQVPAIDWSILRNFSRQFGYGGGQVENRNGNGPAPSVHRSTPEYKRKSGQFFWTPSEHDQ